MEEILAQDAQNHLNKLDDWMGEEVNKVFINDELRSVVSRVSSRNILSFWFMSFACRMTGLGSINQYIALFHQTKIKLWIFFFQNLLERGFWIAQRGLVSLSFVMITEDGRGSIKATVEAVQKGESNTEV